MPCDSFGFDSAWDTGYSYAVTPILTNTVDANRDMNALANDLGYNARYSGNAGFERVAFLGSRAVVGDLNDGVRIVISWPANHSNWTLLSTTNLAGTGTAWTAISPAPYQTNTAVLSWQVPSAGGSVC